MKILTVVVDLGLGGTQRAAQVFAEAYDELGNDSKILPLYGMGSRIQELSHNVEVLCPPNYLTKIYDWSPDLVHFHTTGLKLKDVENVIKNTNNPNCKFCETNVFSKPSPWADLMHVSFQLSTWANWIFQLKGGKPYPSRIIPNAIRINSFFPAPEAEQKSFRKEIGVPEKAILMGRIGQPFPGKWSPLLIDVFNELAAENASIYLVLVNAPENILTKAQNSKHKDRIRQIPKIIGDSALSVAYSSMNMMVHIAEQGESFGIVLCECILCKTPVVSLSTPWNDNSQCEVIGHGKGGLIAHSKQGLIKAVQTIIEGKAKINLNQRIKEIKRDFNHLETAQKVLDHFNEKNHFSRKISVSKILKNSIDKPNFFTYCLILLNRNAFRKTTIFTSGYRDVKLSLIKKTKRILWT